MGTSCAAPSAAPATAHAERSEIPVCAGRNSPLAGPADDSTKSQELHRAKGPCLDGAWGRVTAEAVLVERMQREECG